MSSGIYCITNMVNGHIYIGSTVDIKKRRREHFSALRRGLHRNQYLQRAFDKYGEGCFAFSILESIINRGILEQREQYWIDLAQTEEGHLYNLDKTATRTMFIKPKTYWLGKKRSPTDIKKFVDSHLGKVGIMRCDNSTGFTGIEWLAQNRKYRARITINYKTIELGSYKYLLPAVITRTLAEELFTGVIRD